MARLTEIPTTTTMTDDDLFYIVDVEDTTDNPAGSSKSIKKSDVIGNVQKFEIARITDPGAGGFVFAGYTPSEWDRLYIQGQVKSSAAATIDATEILFNGDATTANYFYQRLAGLNAGTSVPASATTRCATVTGATNAVANSITDVAIEIENPNSSFVKSAISHYRLMQTATAAESGSNATWNPSITVPLTAITIRTDNDPTDTLTGTLILYGEKTI